MPPDHERLEATIVGRVQGVGFRYHVLRAAAGLAITGWVANERDGSVHCVAEGARPDLERLLDALHEGPAGARVDHVATFWGGAAGRFSRFSVRSAGHAGD